jgi:hypothetical protein
VARRRTREQIEADQIIKRRLNELGEIAYQEAKDNSRVRTGRLRDSVNYMVRPDTRLTMAQVYYGKYQQPDELMEAINRNIDNSIDLIVQEIADVSTALILNINDN